MVGIPGAGKSFFADHFAETFNAPIISDKHIRDDLFSDPAFSTEEQKVIHRVRDRSLKELFKTQRTLIMESATGTRVSRQELAKVATTAGYEPLFVWVQTEPSSAKARAIKRVKGQPSLSAEQFDAAVRAFTAPNQAEQALVISGKHTYASQLKIVLKKLSESRGSLAEKTLGTPRPVAPTPAKRNVLIR